MAQRLRRLFFVVFMGLAAPAVASAQSSVHDFRLGGSAYVLDEECVRLTPDRPYVSGSAWYEKSVDLSRAFEIRLSIALGHKDGQGADGIVFVLHPVAQTGWRGEGMGFAGLSPSVGLEFDTYQNFHLRDPSADHLALMRDGRRNHGAAGRGVVRLENLEDGARHPLRIAWDPRTKRLTVTLDQRERASVEIDLVGDVFGGESVVYWGFSAGTGRLSNEQDVCIEKLLLASG
jgi:hypothetical protein